ncbi:MAG: SUMF1/EgtB/PvdO family nonheme iron enzyme [Muribaculaceae bacterium]|nr:SUMF1/EgtB/PvdO family nonheme iron enzyme [Muribaculaceae bacterium]
MNIIKVVSGCVIIAVSTASAQTVGSDINDFIPMVEIPAGSFCMGGDGWWSNMDETPVHMVELTSPMRMGVTPVTNKQFEAFCPEHRALRGIDGVSTADDEAVVNVTYEQALDFCRWLGETYGGKFRLPTEAEWEYACRAGTYTRYNTGETLPAEYCRNQRTVRNYSSTVDLRVGLTAPNAFGLTDMHGLVEEWCLDWYAPYLGSDQVNPAGPEYGEFRITRGGSHSTPVAYLQSSNRMAMHPADSHSLTGFRVVQSDAALNHYGSEIKNEAHYCIKIKKNWKKISDKEVIFNEPIRYLIRPDDTTTPFYLHNHQPAITYALNGDLIAIWFSTTLEDGRELCVLSSRLKDGERQWSPASVFFHIADRNLTGSSLLTMPDGSIMHLNGMGTAGDWQNLALVKRMSYDCGHTWTPVDIISPRHVKRHQLVAGPIITSDGSIVQMCDAGPGGNAGAAIHISNDGGLTWKDQWDGAPVKFALDSTGTTVAGIHAGIVELNDGRFMCLGRGNSLPGPDGTPRMPMSISSDKGKTWHYTASEFPPIYGGQRLVLKRLHNGALLLISFTDHPQRTLQHGGERGMIFTRADGSEFRGYGMYAALSFDDGKTWPVRKLMTDGLDRSMNGAGWTGNFIMDRNHAENRGYLAITQTPDNMIHLISSRNYYSFSIAWLMQPNI